MNDNKDDAKCAVLNTFVYDLITYAYSIHKHFFIKHHFNNVSIVYYKHTRFKKFLNQIPIKNYNSSTECRLPFRGSFSEGSIDCVRLMLLDVREGVRCSILY